MTLFHCSSVISAKRRILLQARVRDEDVEPPVGLVAGVEHPYHVVPRPRRPPGTTIASPSLARMSAATRSAASPEER